MSTPKHTPGPWRILDSRGQGKATIVGSDFPAMGFVADVNLCRNNTHQQVDGRANAALIAAAPVMYKTIQHLLEWAKGNRGSKTGNPYCIPEVRHALKTLASIQGVKDYLDADTTVEGGL